MSINLTLPEAEFGLGISDSAHRQQTWTGMERLFQQGKLSDVILTADGQSIPCHRFLLAASSQYLYRMCVVETETPNTLEIEGITFTALKVIVSYLYTGSINITAENARDVIPACKMLKLTSAYDICIKFAMEIINPGNCIGLYKMATQNDVSKLSSKALDVMESNFSEVVSGRQFLALSEKDVADYIQNEFLKIPNEDLVFEAVVSWVKHHPREREPSFRRLITHVRLRYCSPDYLTQVVSNERLMENHGCQKHLTAALVHQRAAPFPDSGKRDGIEPRKGYRRVATLLIIGGRSDPGDVTRSDCWRLEDAEWKVMGESPMPELVTLFSACVVKEGILVTGGFRSKKSVSQCWLLSTSTYQWSPLPDLNTARGRHASVCVGGQLYVIAGEGSDENVISSIECLPRSDAKWKHLPDMPKALIHTMAVSYAECVYVFGGRDMRDKDSQSVFVYSTKRNAWQTLADLPHVCSFGSAVVWKDRIYIVGGFSQSCMRYDPILAQWSALSQCRHQHADAPALVSKDRILVCGGRSKNAKRDNGDPGGTSVIEEYDPETDTWTVSEIELPQKLHAHAVFSTDTGNLA